MPTEDRVTSTLLWIIDDFLELNGRHKALRAGHGMGELGADSFDMVELQARIEEELHILIEAEISVDVTFDQLLKLVRQAIDAQPGRPGPRR
ncbi:phosphopantetheine-binding protein [Pseudomonas sichuanensis]|uniref:phosphopantetheine-binding protein n=1 Tax=Pseudomonas sichuanensis TaxID=2213015 RepID=UPI0024493D25|nr:phosphopantetheine-binding protein [Pseudomonas sichuanensis]MDH0731794.1 phosphopantetheine-binding protein [Pseudomonas sichuanensis]MDH1583940.1 phosphopantetheine-binding protein [Pseudomonas sichuanensis]MDH1595563.1 phosphopantetheine-binding protein [Pseudomonas sichuanensis]MDH1598137.1 phosphopantetheine-binding protein [Pseudomonas sichuanensis]